MRKFPAWQTGRAAAAVAAITLAFPGCATMDDGDKTRAQGTAVGAVAGAVIGGGLGALIGLASGGRAEDIIAGAIIGGTSGAVAGGVAGYQYGMMVAQRKAEYARSEDFYIAQIGEIHANTAMIRDANLQLAGRVRSLELRRSQLDAALAKGQIDRRSYEAEVASVRHEANSLRRQGKPAVEMVQFQRAVMADAGENGAPDEVAEELSNAAADQEKAFGDFEEMMTRLSTVGQPTRG